MTAETINSTLSIQQQLKRQERTQLIYTLLSVGILLVFLVTGFQFASNRSAGGLGKMFVDTWPHDIVFVERSTGNEIPYEPYVTPEFEEQYGERTDYPQRLQNLVAEETGLGGREVVLTRDWGAFWNPLNVIGYLGNIGGQLFDFLIRVVTDAIQEPGRIFIFPAYKAGDADAEATIFEGTGYQYCPWGQSYAQAQYDADQARNATEAGTNLSQGATQSVFTSGDSGLRQQRDERRLATAELPCAGPVKIIQNQPKAAWVVYVWHAIQTLNYALFATMIGGAIGLLLALIASRNIIRHRGINFAARRVLDICRAFPELIIVFVLAIAFVNGSLVPIIAAVAFHTTGALGKLFAEVIENADMKPLEGLAASGGSFSQRILFGLMPQVVPNLLSYGALRVEINVRASAILGFVGGTGFGQDLNLAESRDNGIAVVFLLMLLVLMIVLIDQVSLRLRRRLIGAQMGG